MTWITSQEIFYTYRFPPSLVLTPKTMGCLRLVYQDLSPYGTYGHEILHACSIWPILLEYNIKFKFYCLKTA